MASNKRNPQHTRMWRFLNDAPYRSRLKEEKDKKFLDEFNSEYWNDRPRDDAMEVAAYMSENSVHWSNARENTPSSRDAYSSITPADIKAFFLTKELSERKIAKELGMPRTTLQAKFKTIRKMLEELSFDDLVPFLPDEITKEELSQRLDQIKR